MKAKKKKRERLLRLSVELPCPFCGQLSAISVDEGGGERQTYVEDCSVCCHPRVIHLNPSLDPSEGPQAWIERGDGF